MFRGATPPETSVAPARSAPSGRSARRLLRSGEWAIWPLNGLRAKKNSTFSGSRGWILDPWGGRVNARNEKPVLADGSFRSRRVRALFDRVTGPKRDPATETPFQSSGIQSHSFCQWRISVSARLGIMSCRRVGCRGRPRRGIPHMAKRATAHHASYASQA